MKQKTVEEVANELATEHKHEDPETVAVYLSKAAAEVRLVEVTGSVGNTGEVLPFRFEPRPDLGIAYPTFVVLLSREEWSGLKAGSLELPQGWGRADDLKKIA